MRRSLTALLLAAGCSASSPPPPAPPAARPPSPSATVAAPPPSAPIVVSPSPVPGLIGTANPVLVAAAASDGGWTVVCQPRADTDGDGRIWVRPSDSGALVGDRMDPFLVLGDGPGRRIDELAAASGDGRWLVIKVDGRLRLIDARTRSELDLGALGADARSDAASFQDHRAVAFDPAGKHLAYLRNTAGHDRIVLRELETGGEREIDPGPGEVWRIAFDAAGGWLDLQVVATDRNGNGRLDWPIPATPVNGWRCQGPPARMSVWPDHGDRAEQRFVALGQDVTVSGDGALAPCGQALLRRTEHEELVLDAGNQRTVLEPASCKARLLHADCSRNALIVACSGSKSRRPPLELVGSGYRLPLGADIAPLAHDEPSTAASGARFVPISSGTSPIVVDLEARRAIPLHSGDSAVASAGDHVLLRRGERLVLWNVAAQTEAVLPGELAPYGAVLRTRDTVLFEPLIVDVANGRVLGSAPGVATALDVAGRSLIAETPAVPGESLALGPLSWKPPLPIPAAP